MEALKNNSAGCTALVPIKNDALALIPKIVSYDTKHQVKRSYDSPTLTQFEAVEQSFEYFNNRLFNGRLKPVVFTLIEGNKSMGHYRSQYWHSDTKWFAEIAINPKILSLSLIDVYSTIVHEMAHHYQHCYGNPSRGNYHNHEFATIMEGVGLVCSDTGLPGGKKTGQSMSDYPIPGGVFIRALEEMPVACAIPFKVKQNKSEKISPKSKFKYTCTACNANVWGKQGLCIMCMECQQQLIIIKSGII